MVSTGRQLPELLDHSGCWANVPVEKVSANSPVWLHTSPISVVEGPTQAFRNGSVTDSMYSWPAALLQPSKPFCTVLAKQLAPWSGMYGRLVKETLLLLERVAHE